MIRVMKRFLKKIGVSFLLASYLLVSILGNSAFVSKVSAQTPAPKSDAWYHQDFKNWYGRVYSPPKNDVFGERYTAAQVEWIIYGLIAFFINMAVPDTDTANCIMNKPIGSCAEAIKTLLKLVSESPKEGTGAKRTSLENNVLGDIFLQDRPLSAISYVRGVSRNLRIIPEAKAQTSGFGFTALSAIQPIWSASRNAAYGVLVFAILIMSFMIMFRVKINPQTVISVQSAIPRVAIALLLITFSYAIAGLMVDLMYIVIGFLALILSSAYKSLGAAFPLIGADLSPSGLFSYMINGPFNTGVMGSVIIFVIYFSVGSLLALLASGGILGTLAIGALAGTALVLSAGWVFIIGAILFLILLVVVLIMIIRIVWMLTKAFAFVLLLTIVAPLQIALGIVVPGIGFGSWLKSLMSNLSVFPTTGFFIGLAFLFLSAGLGQIFQEVIGLGSRGALIGGLFQSSNGWPPLLGNGTATAGGFLLMLTSLILLLLLPKVADIIKSLIEGKPFSYGSAIGEALGPGTGIAGLALLTQTSPIEASARKYGRSTWEELRNVWGRGGQGRGTVISYLVSKGAGTLIGGKK